MNRYIWLGFLSVLMLTGCGGSAEEEQERKAKEFRTAKYPDSHESAKREKLYKECHKNSVRSIVDIRNEAKRISGNDNNGSKEAQAVFRQLDRERDAALAKCIQIRTGN